MRLDKQSTDAIYDLIMVREREGGHGGWRPGAGRPVGAKDKRTVVLLEQGAVEGLDLPLPRLLRRMNGVEPAAEIRSTRGGDQPIDDQHALGLHVPSAPRNPTQAGEDDITHLLVNLAAVLLDAFPQLHELRH